MASRLSETLHLIAGIRESARRGDWVTAGDLAKSVGRQLPPADPEELGVLLQQLKEALIVARTSRAHSAASLVRLNAAARFNHVRADFSPVRQKFGDAADFRR